jgi:cell division protein FtsB
MERAMAARTASGALPRGLGATRARGRPARGGGSPLEGVRWDRLGRVALLLVLVALLYLYLSAGVHLFSTWSDERRDNAAVAALQREHARLAHQHEALGRQSTLEAEARRLGMIKPGEQPYVVTGLPSN